MAMSSNTLRIAVLLSGEGTNLENLFRSIDNGTLPAEIAVVISSRRQAGGLQRATDRNVPSIAIPRKDFRRMKVLVFFVTHH